MTLTLTTEDQRRLQRATQTLVSPLTHPTLDDWRECCCSALREVLDGDMATFKRWSDVIIQNIGPSLLMGDDSGVAPTRVEFDAYFSKRLDLLREKPDGSLKSILGEYYLLD